MQAIHGEWKVRSFAYAMTKFGPLKAKCPNCEDRQWMRYLRPQTDPATKETFTHWCYSCGFKKNIEPKEPTPGRGGQCLCRSCGTHYSERGATATLAGYCSQACLHYRARKLGYKASIHKQLGYKYSEASILRQAGEIGTIKVPKERR